MTRLELLGPARRGALACANMWRVGARLVGINHVALEVTDVEAALSFYGRLFPIELRGRAPGMAFIDIGDQFIALSEGRTQPADDHRHFGLVVDDRNAALHAAREAGAELVGSHDFRDPWGNRVQLVEYGDVQFTKDARVLAGMEVPHLEKSESAEQELRKKGLR